MRFQRASATPLAETREGRSGEIGVAAEAASSSETAAVLVVQTAETHLIPLISPEQAAGLRHSEGVPSSIPVRSRIAVVISQLLGIVVTSKQRVVVLLLVIAAAKQGITVLVVGLRTAE